MLFDRLREELKCSICLSIYTYPVTLRCGHNFCRGCIDRVLDTQRESGEYSCPECRQKVPRRPQLVKNKTLYNIVHFLSIEPNLKDNGTLCTHCIHSPIAAVKFCLYCDAFLCHNHLRVHKKSPEHVLTNLAIVDERGRCPVHKQVLKYFCTQDDACICESCYVAGEHNGHPLNVLDEVFKKRLRHLQKNVVTEAERSNKRVQNLHEDKTKALGKANSETERVTAVFTLLKERLEDLEKRVQGDIMKQTEMVALNYDEVIQRAETENREISSKMGHVELLCTTPDPLTALQESHAGDQWDDGDRARGDVRLPDGGDLKVLGVSGTLHMGLADILKEVTAYFYMPDAVDILLDPNTAGKKMIISDDRKTAYWSYYTHRDPDTPEKFQDVPQVLSCLLFTAGPYYWEVDVGGSKSWCVGVCYPSITRKGRGRTRCGWNRESWALSRCGYLYSVTHDETSYRLPEKISSDRVGVYLDCRAGQISFYDLSAPIRHVFTFTTTFTGPLHAVFGVAHGYLKMCERNPEV
ncbi:E3 ubiquitin-protein ligase TRIM11-like [Hyperolius riggenbachi]|uniref:E3 ubiquitin-protein ligase TRIM11-like n=1 Tax=Hyperolius riggenbachi TaxID=752182 RepID=UPI0035A2AAEF